MNATSPAAFYNRWDAHGVTFCTQQKTLEASVVVAMGLPEENIKFDGWTAVGTRTSAGGCAILLDPAHWHVDRQRVVKAGGVQNCKALFVQLRSVNPHRDASTGSSTQTVSSPDPGLQIVITKNHRGLFSEGQQFDADERRAVFQIIASAIDPSLP